MLPCVVCIYIYILYLYLHIINILKCVYSVVSGEDCEHPETKLLHMVRHTKSGLPIVELNELSKPGRVTIPFGVIKTQY